MWNIDFVSSTYQLNKPTDASVRVCLTLSKRSSKSRLNGDMRCQMTAANAPLRKFVLCHGKKIRVSRAFSITLQNSECDHANQNIKCQTIECATHMRPSGTFIHHRVRLFWFFVRGSGFKKQVTSFRFPISR